MLNALLQEFGESIGIPDLAFDANNFCALTFDDTAVMFSHREQQGRLLLYSDIGFNAQPSPEFLLHLLQANALHSAVGDGTIGASIDEKRNGLVLVYSLLLDTESLNLQRFSKVLEQFIVMVESWHKQLAQYVDSTEDEHQADDDPLQNPAIRV